MAKVFVGQTVTIKLETGIPLTDPGTAEISAKRPDGTTTTWTASISDPSAGIIEYTTTTTDLSIAGNWFLNAVWKPDPQPGDIFYGCTACLSVSNLGVCD